MTARAIALAALICALLPAAAEAHAVLERTSPAQGVDLDRQPERVAFFFDEPVEASFGSVRVFDTDGSEVQDGDVVRPGGDDEAVAAGLRPGLPDGTYTATYHVISADSHPAAGGFVFSIGRPTAGAASVAELLDRGGSGRVTSTAFWAARWFGYAAIGLALGGLVFLVAAWRPALGATARNEPERLAAGDAFGHRARLLLGAAIAAGIVASLAALPLEIATASGGTFFDGLDPSRLAGIVDTRFGTVMALRAAAWALLAVVLLAAGRAPRAAVTAAAAIALAFLAIAPALTGHASTQSPGALLFPADVVHVTAMSAWLGGLAFLLGALPAATRLLAGRDRTRLLLASLKRFSALALASVVALAVTGTIQAIIEVGSLPALVETGFGRAVLAKIALFATLIGLGAANRQRLLPALERLVAAAESPGRIGVALRRNLRFELGLIGVVLAVTAVLVSYAPAGRESSGPVSGRTTIGSAELEYTVDPARAGANQIHLYLFDAADGTQLEPASPLRATVTEPERDIGPLDLELNKAGPGHYVARGAQIGAPGTWELTATLRVSRFDSDEVTVEVPIG